ncbi:T9SS type A sorting domain-containing protein [Marinigracilibium pacificum]|uniref:T9SS type A sorting domain-containing protein n=1 Tax=Marinigracilibium pacificum TaxID=2729599 RepID=A0A848J090_9BACT|nr:T9SS type A sorting domain-containing protein [Marinigracilibium pacificum]NMM49071.1 T9SS type A sorting domain-containing protein [Marinigracilibium pacificum]
MKTLIKNLLCAVLLIGLINISFVSNAKNFDPKRLKSGLIFDVKKIDNQLKLRLDIRQPNKDLVMIKVMDEKGVELYKAFTSKSEHSSILNLSNLGYGDYQVEIASGGESKIENISFDKPVYLDSKLYIKHSPNDKTIKVYGRNLEKPAKISIQNSAGRYIIKDYYNLQNFNDKLDTKRLRKGIYTVTVKSADITESMKIEIK